MRFGAGIAAVGFAIMLAAGLATAQSAPIPSQTFAPSASSASSLDGPIPSIIAPLAKPSLALNNRAAANSYRNLSNDWRTLDDRMRAVGLSVGASWVMEGFRNFQGGITTEDTVPASTLDLYASLDTRPLLGFSGGEFYADLEDHAGQDPSTVLVGDLQVFDKLNYSPYLQIFELWYQQRLFGNRLRVKLGKIDANTEFSVITNGLNFISSSTQVTPTIFVFPTTPDPMPAVAIFFNPSKLFYASFGAFYSNSGDRFLDFVGTPYAIQPTRNGAFLIGETGLTWRHLPILRTGGDLRLGLWGQTGSFRKFDGRAQNGADGTYAILDQTLWHPVPQKERDHALRGFLEYGRTEQSVSPIYEHFGGGFTWTGFPDRPYDMFGFSPQYARLSPEAGFSHNYELALESFYNLWLTPELAVQPDLQYIVNPGGRYPDALVGTLRLKLDL